MSEQVKGQPKKAKPSPGKKKADINCPGKQDVGGRRSAADLQRSHTMSRIRSSDTAIEVKLRKALWHAGIRYRKNYRKLPGSPDIAVTKHKIAIFCDGDFWHGKDWADKKQKMQSNREFWIGKIDRNIRRDVETDRSLSAMDWAVIRFWGSEIERDLAKCVSEVKEAILRKEVGEYGDIIRLGDWESGCACEDEYERERKRERVRGCECGCGD